MPRGRPKPKMPRLEQDQIEAIVEFVRGEVWDSTYNYGDCGRHTDRADDAVRAALGTEPVKNRTMGIRIRWADYARERFRA